MYKVATSNCCYGYKVCSSNKHLNIGFILLAVLLLLEAELPWAVAPFPEGLLEFISADF